MSKISYKDLSLLLLRVGMGGLFLWAGLDKVTAPFSASGYLNSASGPLADTFKSLAGNTTIELLVAWGLTLGGLALVLGIFTKLATAGLALLMILIYLSHFPPSAPNHLVDDHVIYVLILGLLCEFEAGKVWGLVRWVKVPKLLQ